MHATDVIAWVYRADVYCDACTHDMLMADERTAPAGVAYSTDDLIESIVETQVYDYAETRDSETLPQPVFADTGLSDFHDDACGACHEPIVQDCGCEHCQWGGDDEPTVNLHDVARIMRDRGVAATVRHTGGGIWTLFLGTMDSEGYAQVVVGPGWATTYGALVSTYDLNIGPDDGGDSVELTVIDDGRDMSAQDVADIVVTYLHGRAR